ncbi:branched-chain amino acid ABC transporter substrate-binding protein [Aquabacterium sp. OR-4]|uniref:branched-chain amino acid ABC transporter substrate-binding protein n=1 Tax=Aquabacterium sp. OR-4 TaxID=2978127 RepID=UPI0021B30ACA|nr:branched-chain amino acid ABC transporter substrate-binding protein [Aquabacterium sp. OR-4]MDT7835080.1 branched-chain amino acid ABC transporter substrate-binding protein [Aquabacterium sp. OR-4]
MNPTPRLAALPAALLMATASQAAPVKIGLLETLSGPQASTGQTFRAGVRFAIDRINAAGGWNGEPVQLVEYDNQGGPAGASDKLKAAIADGVQIVVQGASSAIAGQITEDVRKHNLRNPGKELAFINIGAEALELTGEKCNFHHFRLTGNAQVRTKVLVQGMKQAKALGTKVYSINQNYSWGQDMERAIGDNAAAGGYKVVEKTLHDVNKIQDFAPYIAKITASGAETVITGNWSNDLLLMMKAAKAAGLKADFGTVFLDQPGNISNAGDTAIGHFIAHVFNGEAGGAEGAKFVSEYTAKTGHAPVFVEAQSVFALEMVADALRRTKPVGGALSVNAFARAMETAKIRTPMGEMSMRAADHQVLLPLVVSTVSREARYKVDGTDLGFKPVRVYSAEESAMPVQAACTMQRPS